MITQTEAAKQKRFFKEAQGRIKAKKEAENNKSDDAKNQTPAGGMNEGAVENKEGNGLGGNDSFNGKDLDKIRNRYNGWDDLQDKYDNSFRTGPNIIQGKYGSHYIDPNYEGPTLWEVTKGVAKFLNPFQDIRECSRDGCGIGGWLIAGAAITPWGKIFSKAKKLRTADDFFEHADALGVSTPRNSAVFYSGRGNRELAEQFATSNNRLTIEMTAGGKWLDRQKLFDGSMSNADAMQVWNRLSKSFADGASGNAIGFVRGARLDRTFNTIEYPALLNNKNITNVLTGGN